MAEHGVRDFGLAKRKAAERFGISHAGVLPRTAVFKNALPSGNDFSRPSSTTRD